MTELELFDIFGQTREIAIENFQVSEQIREKFQKYDHFLNNLEQFI
jgi:hypothetical protein